MLTLKHLLEPEIKLILVNDNKVFLYPDINCFSLEQINLFNYILLKSSFNKRPAWHVYQRNEDFLFDINQYADLLNMINGTKTQFDWQKEGF